MNAELIWQCHEKWLSLEKQKQQNVENEWAVNEVL